MADLFPYFFWGAAILLAGGVGSMVYRRLTHADEPAAIPQFAPETREVSAGSAVVEFAAEPNREEALASAIRLRDYLAHIGKKREAAAVSKMMPAVMESSP